MKELFGDISEEVAEDITNIKEFHPLDLSKPPEEDESGDEDDDRLLF
jgi:hypothetical protein